MMGNTEQAEKLRVKIETARKLREANPDAGKSDRTTEGKQYEVVVLTKTGMQRVPTYVNIYVCIILRISSTRIKKVVRVPLKRNDTHIQDTKLAKHKEIPFKSPAQPIQPFLGIGPVRSGKMSRAMTL